MTRTIIGRAACGCIRLAVVLDETWPKLVGDSVRDMLKAGLRVETIDGSADMKRCPHGLDPERAEPSKQEALL